MQTSGMDSEARAFVDAQRVARLSTAGADGDPHVVPVVFARLDDTIYIAIDEKPKTTLLLRRLRNIAENPRAALLLDVYDDDWSQLRWLLLRGPASVLNPTVPQSRPGRGPQSPLDSERRDALAALRARYPQYESMALEDRPMIRLQVERATGWRGAARD